MNDVGYYLLFDHVEIEGANAVSSPITYGFPAITGFLGAVHALSRRLPLGQDIQLDGVLIASHGCHVNRFRPHSYSDYTFNQTRNPIKKNGQTASIIEEGKANITVSLLVEVRCSMQSYTSLKASKDVFAEQLKQYLYLQRVAGGSVRSIRHVELYSSSVPDQQWKTALLPAFVLMDARQDLVEITRELQNQTPEATTLDALLDVVTVHHLPEQDERGKVNWKAENVKTGRGWLVPMPIGFQAIAPQMEAGTLAHCRNPEYPSQYSECLYGLGKWVFPHRLGQLSHCFWRYSHTEDNTYLVTQIND